MMKDYLVACLGEYPSHVSHLIEELLSQENPNFDRIITRQRAARDAEEKFNVAYQFEWSKLTYIEDVKAGYERLLSGNP